MTTPNKPITIILTTHAEERLVERFGKSEEDALYWMQYVHSGSVYVESQKDEQGHVTHIYENAAENITYILDEHKVVTVYNTHKISDQPTHAFSTFVGMLNADIQEVYDKHRAYLQNKYDDDMRDYFRLGVEVEADLNRAKLDAIRADREGDKDRLKEAQEVVQSLSEELRELQRDMYESASELRLMALYVAQPIDTERWKSWTITEGSEDTE